MLGLTHKKPAGHHQCESKIDVSSGFDGFNFRWKCLQYVQYFKTAKQAFVSDYQDKSPSNYSNGFETGRGNRVTVPRVSDTYILTNELKDHKILHSYVTPTTIAHWQIPHPQHHSQNTYICNIHRLLIIEYLIRNTQNLQKEPISLSDDLINQPITSPG